MSSLRRAYRSLNLTSRRKFLVALPCTLTAIAAFWLAAHPTALARIFTETSTRPDAVSSCVTPPNGLVSWWAADNTAADVTGTDDGTINGSVSFVAGEVGNAFSFDGNGSNYVSAPANAALDLSVFTVDAWIYPTSSTGARYILDKTASGVGTNYYLALTTDNLVEFGFNDGNYRFVDSATSVPVNQWSHVAGTYDGSTIKVYINGTLSNSFVFSGSPPTGEAIRMGVDNSGSYAFTGNIDEVEVFSRALTDAEVLSIYSAGSAGKCRSCTAAPANLISWWPGDGNTQDIVSGNNGFLINGATFGTGEVGQAFSFNGGSYVSVPDATNLHFSSELTLDAWIYPTDLTTYGAGVMLTKIHQSSFGYEFDYFPGGFLRLYISADGSTYDSRDSALGVVTTNQWQHVAVTFNAGSVHFYVNGVDVGSGTFNSTSIFPGTDDLFIGSNGANAPVVGKMDEVEAFNRALSGSEIQSIYDAGILGKCKPVCTSPPPGLVSWWPGDGNAHDIQDSNDGTLNGASFAAGKVADAFSFDGVDDSVNIPFAANLSLSGAMTYDAWVLVDAVADHYQTLFDNLEPGSFTNGMLITVKGNSSNTLAIYVSSGDEYQVENFFDIGQFTHVAITTDAGVTKVYKNGALFMTLNTPTLVGTTSNTTFGTRVNGTDDPFGGKIDEVEVFNRALLDTEIAAIYNAGGAGKCRVCTPAPPNMADWWKAEGDANDSIGGHDGMLQGGATFAPGEVGQAFEFNGTTSDVTFGNSVGNFGTGDFTVDFWMQSSSTRDEELIGKRPVCDNASFWSMRLGHSETASGIIFAELDQDSSGTNYNPLFGTRMVNDGEFHHVALVRSGTTASLYIDGELDVSGSTAGVTNISNTADLIAGTGPCASSGSHYFTGLLDEIEIFNRALTPDEIRAIADAGSAGKCAACCYAYTHTHTRTGYRERNGVAEADY
jgi:hypothetical protein